MVSSGGMPRKRSTIAGSLDDVLDNVFDESEHDVIAASATTDPATINPRNRDRLTLFSPGDLTLIAGFILSIPPDVL